MPDPVLSSSLFRFVSVRPPQRIAPETVDVHYAPVPNRVLPNLPESEADAREFLRSEQYVLRAPFAREGLRKLAALRAGLEAETLDGKSVAPLLEAVAKEFNTGLAALVKDEVFMQIEDTLWKSYAANITVPDERPYDREQIESTIQTLHLLRAAADAGEQGEEEGDEAEAEDKQEQGREKPDVVLNEPLRVYLQARPLFLAGDDRLLPFRIASDASDHLNQKNAQGSGNEENPPGPEEVDVGDKALGGFASEGQADDRADSQEHDLPDDAQPDFVGDPLERQLARRFQGLLGALDDVRGLFRVHQSALAAQPAPRISLRDQGDRQSFWSERLAGASGRAGVVDIRPNVGVIEADKVTASRLGEERAAQLNEDTRRTLAERGFSPGTSSVPDMIAALETEMRSVVASLAPGIAGKVVRRIGSVYLPQESVGAPQAKALRALPSAGPSGVLRTLPRIRALGIGDLLRVQQTLLRYERGEIAHIENVLAREQRLRKHRRLRQTEQILIVETERIEESERDLQSTERFEMQRESQATIETEMSLQAGVNVTGTYGFVTATAYADFATSSARSEANRNATRIARDITERSAARILERAREERTRRTLEEFEELNEHGFNNTDGAGHITGLYRWVDKLYQARVVNYGRRLMLEFIVPEPASFYIFAEQNRATEGESIARPDEPLIVVQRGGALVVEPLRNYSQIEPWNFVLPISQLNVSGVESPPPEYTILATAVDQPPADGGVMARSLLTLEVPEGYLAATGESHSDWAQSGGGAFFSLNIGNNMRLGDGPFTLNWEDQVVPVSILSSQLLAFVVNIEIVCVRRGEWLDKWRRETFNAIMTEYQTRLADYEERLAAARIQQGVIIEGRNPARNREIERQELKKACLSVMSGDHFDQFNAIESSAVQGYPQVDIAAAATQGPTVQFLEQAFEWNQMTYLFYPYFWGRKDNWLQVHQLEDTDPLFTNFLQAGAARVQVPVRPPYEGSVLYYLSTAPPSIWNGGNPPAIGDPLYLSVAEELRARTGGDGDGEPVGEPWQYRVPTSLVVLDEAVALPDWAAQPDNNPGGG